MIDAVYGIEWRAVPEPGRGAWMAQWRPVRALPSFPTFSFMSLEERFGTENEALEFVRRNAQAIVSPRT